MKIGVYGGTFNPIHRGHLTAAAAAARQLSLDKLLLIPDAVPPHKAMPAGSAGAEDRLEMVRLCTGELPVPAEVSDMEIRRQGASYTCDTLRTLCVEHPGDELWLLMGSDMFFSFETWQHPESICRMAHLAVFSRREGGEAERFARHKKRLERIYGARIALLENPEVVEISSTELREKLSRGEGREYLTDPVYGYILRKGLYGTAADMKHLAPEELRPIALSYLKPKRMPHVLGTEQEAAFLAEKYGADVTAARNAALLHDCTKKLDMDQQLSLCRHYGIALDEVEQKNLKLLHAKTGAAVARDKFGVTDEIYNAIFYHTTGKADMTLLEKIIYLADYIEPSRSFPGVEVLRRAVHADLDQGLYRALLDSIKELQGYGSPVHRHTREALDFIQSEIGGTKE